MSKELRAETFKSPATGKVSDKPEVLATQSYVYNELEKFKTSILNLLQATTILTESKAVNPDSNNVYVLNDGVTLTVGEPVIPSGVLNSGSDSWKPTGIRITVLSKAKSTLNIGTRTLPLVAGQYYEFIYIGSEFKASSEDTDTSGYLANDWVETNTWYARWKA